MQGYIVEQLRQIEQLHQVKVLIAVESGSRSWGWASKDSDYDVRFIYIHPMEWYLTIETQGMGKKRDVIELIDNQLDMSGWEITKALRLFRKSNPSILEWMRSNKIYLQQTGFIFKLRMLEKEVYNPKPVLYHYMQIAKKNASSLKRENVNMKSYLHAYRSLFTCKWIKQYQEFPPVHFQQLIEKVPMDSIVRGELEKLVQYKILGERDMMQPNPILNDYIEQELKLLNEALPFMSTEKKDPTPQLDALFRSTLFEAWGV